jgi:hypothetical protein
MGLFKPPGAKELVAPGCMLLDRGSMGAAFDEMRATADA